MCVIIRKAQKCALTARFSYLNSWLWPLALAFMEIRQLRPHKHQLSSVSCIFSDIVILKAALEQSMDSVTRSGDCLSFNFLWENRPLVIDPKVYTFWHCRNDLNASHVDSLNILTAKVGCLIGGSFHHYVDALSEALSQGIFDDRDKSNRIISGLHRRLYTLYVALDGLTDFYL